MKKYYKGNCSFIPFAYKKRANDFTSSKFTTPLIRCIFKEDIGLLLNDEIIKMGLEIIPKSLNIGVEYFVMMCYRCNVFNLV